VVPVWAIHGVAACSFRPVLQTLAASLHLARSGKPSPCQRRMTKYCSLPDRFAKATTNQAPFWTTDLLPATFLFELYRNMRPKSWDGLVGQAWLSTARKLSFHSPLPTCCHLRRCMPDMAATLQRPTCQATLRASKRA